MAQFLGFAVDTVEKSLFSLFRLAQNTPFKPKPYAFEFNSIAHVLLCSTASFMIWRLIFATEEIQISKINLTLYMMLLFVNWIIFSSIYYLMIRLFDSDISYAMMLKAYTFVHSSILFVSSMIVFVLHIFFNDISTSEFTVFKIELIALVGGANAGNVENFFLYGSQILFIVFSVLLTLLYEPAQYKLFARVTMTYLYMVTAVITLCIISVQLRLWLISSNTKIEVIRIITSIPELFNN